MLSCFCWDTWEYGERELRRFENLRSIWKNISHLIMSIEQTLYIENVHILWLVVKKNTSCFMWVEEEWRSRFQVISLVCTLKSSALCLVTFKSSAWSRCRSCSRVVARMYHTKGVELMTRHDRPSSSQVSCYSSLHNSSPDIIRAVWWGIDAVFSLLLLPSFIFFILLVWK